MNLAVADSRCLVAAGSGYSELGTLPPPQKKEGWEAVVGFRISAVPSTVSRWQKQGWPQGGRGVGAGGVLTVIEVPAKAAAPVLRIAAFAPRALLLGRRLWTQQVNCEKGVSGGSLSPRARAQRRCGGGGGGGGGGTTGGLLLGPVLPWLCPIGSLWETA